MSVWWGFLSSTLYVYVSTSNAEGLVKWFACVLDCLDNVKPILWTCFANIKFFPKILRFHWLRRKLALACSSTLYLMKYQSDFALIVMVVSRFLQGRFLIFPTPCACTCWSSELVNYIIVKSDVLRDPIETAPGLLDSFSKRHSFLF